MKYVDFEWDENKNAIRKKHNISFEEAKTVLYDEEALMIEDIEQSEYEERFIILRMNAILLPFGIRGLNIPINSF